jgi:hypothetical protein
LLLLLCPLAAKKKKLLHLLLQLLLLPLLLPTHLPLLLPLRLLLTPLLPSNWLPHSRLLSGNA